MSPRSRDVTAGEQHSPLSRACCVAAGALSAAMSAAATDKHLQSNPMSEQPYNSGLQSCPDVKSRWCVAFGESSQLCQICDRSLQRDYHSCCFYLSLYTLMSLQALLLCNSSASLTRHVPELPCLSASLSCAETAPLYFAFSKMKFSGPAQIYRVLSAVNKLSSQR